MICGFQPHAFQRHPRRSECVSWRTLLLPIPARWRGRARPILLPRHIPQRAYRSLISPISGTVRLTAVVCFCPGVRTAGVNCIHFGKKPASKDRRTQVLRHWMFPGNKGGRPLCPDVRQPSPIKKGRHDGASGVPPATWRLRVVTYS